MIKEARISNGNIKVSEHFRLKELQCKDGTDLVKYCTETLEKIEQLRALTGCKRCNVTSGYRTSAYNDIFKDNVEYYAKFARDFICDEDAKEDKVYYYYSMIPRNR